MSRLTERNTYIDMLRGIAALSVIAIHTAFWGGTSYTPLWFRNFTLILDVPFFFFLSGWAASLHKPNIIKTTKGLGKAWLQWIFFISIVAVMCYLIEVGGSTRVGVSGIKDLLDNYLFLVSIPGIPVIEGSIWFMPYYFLVVLVNTVMVALMEYMGEADGIKRWYMWILVFIFLWISAGHYFFDLDSYVVFYSFFWMLGYNKDYIIIKSWRNLLKKELVMLLGIVISSIWMQIDILDMQRAKFPPSIKYGFYSMITILLAIFFERMLKKHNCFLVHIGSNAIYYFFAQGIGSSINYFFVDRLSINNWLIKFGLTYFINVIITIVIAESLAFAYKNVLKLGGYIVEHCRCYL